jgi:hypothetical protein
VVGCGQTGSHVNSRADETRPSFRWEGTTLYFGSTRAGPADTHVTMRERLWGTEASREVEEASHSGAARASRWTAARAFRTMGWNTASASGRGARKMEYASRARSVSPSCSWILARS